METSMPKFPGCRAMGLELQSRLLHLKPSSGSERLIQTGPSRCRSAATWARPGVWGTQPPSRNRTDDGLHFNCKLSMKRGMGQNAAPVGEAPRRVWCQT